MAVSWPSLIPLAFAAMRRKDDIAKLFELLGIEKGFEHVAGNWDEIQQLGKSLADDLFPGIMDRFEPPDSDEVEADTIKLGATFVQETLNSLPVAEGGADPKLEVDGIFGEKTKAAVENFQSKQGLSVDGEVGTEQTLPRMFRLLDEQRKKPKPGPVDKAPDLLEEMRRKATVPPPTPRKSKRRRKS